MTADHLSTVLPAQELVAPAHWHTVEFISDLHLDPAEPGTLDAWRRYLRSSRADAIFMLGDLFEVWVGDDTLDEPGSFEADAAASLQQAAAQRPLFFMVGNRDFLAGAAFLQRSGMTGLSDPTVLVLGERRILLSHGDALCLEDVDYQRFRALSRSAAWMQHTLGQPLAARRALGKAMRTESQLRKDSGAEYADVDLPATLQWMDATDTQWFIHGHTHRPADHALPADARGRPRTRIVLSDWHLDAHTHRAEVLRVDPQGWQRLPLEMAVPRA